MTKVYGDSLLLFPLISNLIQAKSRKSGEMQVGSHQFTGSASESCPNSGIFLMKLEGNVFWTYLQGFCTLFDFGYQGDKLLGAEGKKWLF